MPSRLYNLGRMFVFGVPGTGNITLANPVPGFLTFAQAGVLNGAVVRYGAKDGNAREVGYATYSSTGPALNARVIESSTNGGAALNLSSNAVISLLPSATDFGSIAPQCGKLVRAGATALSFGPYHGNKIKIAGKLYEIPAAGIAGFANTGIIVNGTGGQNLIANANYLVTCFVNAGVLTGNFSTDITHAASQAVDNEGVEYSIGMGQGHTVLGLIRTNASAQFDNVTTLSWFNRRFKELHLGTANLTTTSGAWVNLTAAYPMMHWGDEPFWLMFSGQANTSHSPSGYAAMDIGVDGANAGLLQYVYYLAGAAFPVNLSGWAFGHTEGYHYVTGMGVAASGAGTLTVNNSVLGWGTFG